MRQYLSVWTAVTAVSSITLALPGQASDSTLAQYSIFNPVPDEKLRPFAADRPNRTYSTSTMDVGRFQIESDLANYIYDNSAKTRNFSFVSPILRYGVTSFAEIQIGTNLFTRLKQGSTDEDPAYTIRGSGLTFLATKINLFGNDGGDQSMAVVAAARLPTATTGLGPERIEASIDVPYTTAIKGLEWSLTVQPGFGYLRNDRNDGYLVQYGAAGQISRKLAENVTIGFEVAGYVFNDIKTFYNSSFDMSITWNFTESTQIDAAIYFGLNNATPFANPYIGISHRF